MRGSCLVRHCADKARSNPLLFATLVASLSLAMNDYIARRTRFSPSTFTTPGARFDYLRAAIHCRWQLPVIALVA